MEELEKNKDIFPNEDEPFRNIDIKRGQSRGLKKGLFSSFMMSKRDQSGQISNERRVGRFKCKISVFNKEDQEKYQEKKTRLMNQIFEIIKDTHMKVYNEPLDIELDNLVT